MTNTIKSQIQHRQPKRWHKLTITVPAQLSITTEAFLATIADGGIQQNEPFSGAPETDLYSYIIYVTIDGQSNQKLSELRDFIDKTAQQHQEFPVECTSEEVVEEDWNYQWKSHFKPCTKLPKK